MMKKYITILLCCALFAGCKKNKVADTSLKCYNVEHLFDVEAKRLCIDSISREISVVHLETSEHIFIKAVIKTYLYKDLLFVLHPDRCSVFDLNGEYLYDIGKYGQGPGEFNSTPVTLFFSNDCVGICDDMQNKILYYTVDGKFLYEHLLPVYSVDDITVIKNDVIAAVLSVRSGTDPRTLFFDAEGNIIDTIKHKTLSKPKNMPSFFYFTNIYPYNNASYLKEAYNDTVFRISDDLQLLPEYIITAGKYSTNYDDLVLNIEKYRKGIKSVVEFESDRYILARTGEGNSTYFLIDKKTDTTEKVLLTYNEEMDELFEDDVRLIGGGTFFEPKTESVPTRFTINGVSEDGKIIFASEYLENSDDNPVIIMLRIKE